MKPLKAHSLPTTNIDEFAAAIAEYGSSLGPRMRGDGRIEDRLRLPINKLVWNPYRPRCWNT
ncbi:hypothetical protein Lesp02_41180 [Lentzea sp. NBRC 105346]|uniref:hypothetical protein n=1 Tax=Lentzea sp. NBRC 105346 TaxID=3032205 RepID=UPI0024A30F17|nr:hypothetical protein [Lentzea sp. NBRC 105346]GLZ31930.1 hypothetical protein Lesp02_41180 [Lentzea sp. NBRC 105346]